MTHKNWIFRRLILLMAIYAVSSCSSEEGFPVLEGSSAKLFSDERVVMINYWASWCLPCIEEMPELAEFREANHSQVEIYAVNYDNPEIEELKSQIEELNVEIPSLLEDPQPILGYERPQVLPATFVLKQGIVQEMLVGPQTQETLEEVLTRWST